MFSVSTEWPSWPERLSGHHLFNHPTGERVYLCMYLSIHSLLHSLLPVYTGQVVCNTHKDGGRHFVSSHFWEHTGSRMWPQLCHPGRCRQTGASLPPGHWTLTGIQFSFRDRTSPRSPGQWSREEPQTYHVWAEALREGFFLLLGCSCPCLQGLPCPSGLKREDSSADRQCVCIWGSLFHRGCWLVRFICGSYQLSVFIPNNVHWGCGLTTLQGGWDESSEPQCSSRCQDLPNMGPLSLFRALLEMKFPRLTLHPRWRHAFLVLELEFWFKTSQLYWGKIFF